VPVPHDIRGQGPELAGCGTQKAEISALRFIGWRDLATGPKTGRLACGAWPAN